MSNRVAKIREHCYLEWNYVTTRNNPADLGSRDFEQSKLCEFWWDGPEWLGDCKDWPEYFSITKDGESEIERKKLKELLGTTVDLKNSTGALLNEFTLRKTLRMLSWVDPFLNKSRKIKLSDN